MAPATSLLAIPHPTTSPCPHRTHLPLPNHFLMPISGIAFNDVTDYFIHKSKSSLPSEISFQITPPSLAVSLSAFASSLWSPVTERFASYSISFSISQVRSGLSNAKPLGSLRSVYLWLHLIVSVKGVLGLFTTSTSMMAMRVRH